LFHLLPRRGRLHDADDDVADARVHAVGPLEHADAHDLPRPAVIRRLEAGVRLYHFAFSTIRTTRHRFSLEMGRVSIISTVSPTPHSLLWSCALNLVVRRMVLPYSGCRMIDSMP